MTDTTLRELLYGQGAHVDPVACVEDISAELAAKQVPGYPHSIWQLVLHMNYWMDYELRKIAGENPHNPDHAIESWPAHPQPADKHWPQANQEWQAAREHFANDLEELARLAGYDSMSTGSATMDKLVVDFDTKKNPRQSTVRATLWQIMAHNSYHVGQIALLRRQAGAWPPERGGDTW
jgi:uncharacterized damage-inducible protein DinB